MKMSHPVDADLKIQIRCYEQSGPLSQMGCHFL